MFSRLSPVRLLVLVLMVFLAACGGGGTAATKTAAVKSIDDHFAIKVGEQTVQMQIAALPEEMEKGLMFRQSMGADEGMLFVYTAPTQMGFWMRNCVFSQTIGFFDASGELKEIYDMYPHDERTVSSHARDLQFALEMNQGWYKRAGVKPGAKLDLKAVAEALKARGLTPTEWGLR